MHIVLCSKLRDQLCGELIEAKKLAWNRWISTWVYLTLKSLLSPPVPLCTGFLSPPISPFSCIPPLPPCSSPSIALLLTLKF